MLVQAVKNRRRGAIIRFEDAGRWTRLFRAETESFSSEWRISPASAAPVHADHLRVDLRSIYRSLSGISAAAGYAAPLHPRGGSKTDCEPNFTILAVFSRERKVGKAMVSSGPSVEVALLFFNEAEETFFSELCLQFNGAKLPASDAASADHRLAGWMRAGQLVFRDHTG